jgi:mono/diheme cytochrome c family protein
MTTILRRGRTAAGALAAFALALGGAVGAGAQLRWDRTFQVPLVDLRASTDPELIERGRYLAYGPAHCAYCHTPAADLARLEAGDEVAMKGGGHFATPLGTFYSPNLTPDPVTGIGRWTDGQIARALRHNVRADGRVAMPFMEFQMLSDDDLVAILSYLRSLEPVRSEVPEHELRLLGKTLFAYVMKPAPPPGTAPGRAPPADGSIRRGDYLANAVANCAGCHSARDLRDGSYTGPRFAGGFEMPVEGDPTRVFVTPNLTPDPRTGVMAGWSEDQFVQRFRTGRLFPTSHMPWAAYQRMSDDDLRAIYRYLVSLDGVENDTGPQIRERG